MFHYLSAPIRRPMSNSKSLKISNWSIVLTILCITIMWFALTFYLHGFNEESVRMNIRWSSKFSLPCFCLAFAASSINKIFSNNFTLWLNRNRKYFGIAFALVHLVHLVFVIILNQFFHQVFEIESILTLSLGGLAYLFIFLMLITSFEKFSKLISIANWKRLHKFGGYWILIVFSNSIFSRIFQGLAFFNFNLSKINSLPIKLYISQDLQESLPLL